MHIALFKSLRESGEGDVNDPYSKILQDAGHKVSLIETLEFSYDPLAMKFSQDWHANYSAVVFTSQRAVHVFGLAGLAVKPDDLCFVVGQATGEAAKSLGFNPLGMESGNAESLSKLIVNDYSKRLIDKPVLFPCGKLHRDILPNNLTEAGIKVHSVVAYSTQENSQLNKQVNSAFSNKDPPAVIVFFSPSGVDYSQKILKEQIMTVHKNIKIVSMGPATSVKCSEDGFTVTSESPSPKPSALLEVVSGLSQRT